MKVINIIGAPGVGKSVLSSKIFRDLKINGYRTEQVVEYAKKLVYENREMTLKDQLYILAKTNKDLNNLQRHNMDFVVMDGSLLLTKYYAQRNGYVHESFNNLASDIYNSYDNILLFIDKMNFDYQNYGRTQSKSEAYDINNELLDFVMKETNNNFFTIDSDFDIMNFINFNNLI